jgi:hypothetical protein
LSTDVTGFRFLALGFFASVVLLLLLLNADLLIMAQEGLSSIWVWWSFKTFSLRKLRSGG